MECVGIDAFIAALDGLTTAGFMLFFVWIMFRSKERESEQRHAERMKMIEKKVDSLFPD